jgi:SPP1 family predicted phage head-tail adaptor
MRAGRLDTKVSFYAKVKTASSDFGGTTDTWPTETISTWGEVKYAGGDLTLSSDEKFYSGTIILTVRYRDSITETMRVKIDDIWYRITYIEELGRDEGMKITLQKIND